MPTKRELITKKIHELLTFAETNELPFHAEIRKASLNYNTEQIVGLLERYIIPAKDCLEEYLDDELERMKLFHPDIANYQPDLETRERVLTDLRYIIKVIEL